MQIQQPPLLSSNTQGRYAQSTNKYTNSRFIQQGNSSKRPIYFQNQNALKTTGNTRGLTPSYNRASNIRESSINGQKKNVDINLNINVNNDGTVNIPDYKHSGLPITHNLNNHIPVTSFRIPPQPMPQFGQIGHLPQMGYPQRIPNLPHFQQQPFYSQYPAPSIPQPIFIGHRNISNPQPTNNIVPQEQKPVILEIEQERVHCVLCDCDYLVSDHEQHKKKHQRHREESTKIKKLVKEYKKYEDPQVRPIVQPEQYNIQYKPNSFVIEQQKKFHTLAIELPDQRQIGTEANLLNQKKIPIIQKKQVKREQKIQIKQDYQQKHIQPPVIVQPVKPPAQNVRLTIEDQQITPFDKGLFLTQRIARQSNKDSVKISNSLRDNRQRQRFERQTFIPEEQGELFRFNHNDSIMKESLKNQHYRLSDNQQSIKQSNKNLQLNNASLSRGTIESKPVEKVQLSMEQFGNFSRVDSSAYRSGATHSRKLNAVGYQPQSSFKKPEKLNIIPIYEPNISKIHEVKSNAPSENYQQNMGFLSSIQKDLNNSMNSRKQAMIHQQPYRESRQNSSKGLLAADQSSLRQLNNSQNHNIEKHHNENVEYHERSAAKPKQQSINWERNKYHQQTPGVVSYQTSQKHQIFSHHENSINNETSHFPQESNNNSKQNSNFLENSNEFRSKHQNSAVEQSSIKNNKIDHPVQSHNDQFNSNILLGIKKADESYESSIGYKDKIQMPLQILDDSKESQPQKRKKLPKYVGGW